MLLGEPVGEPRLRRNATLLLCLQAADTAQKLSTVLFQCLFFKERDPQTDPRCTADAIIYSIKNDGVLVFVPESVSSRCSQEPLEWAEQRLAALVPPGTTLEDLLSDLLLLPQVRRQGAGVPEEPGGSGGLRGPGRRLRVEERLHPEALGPHHQQLW